jgi:cell wall assembly regulator SMI1
MIEEVVSILTANERNGWEKSILSATEEDLKKLEDKLKVQFPQSYRNFLLYSNGGELEGSQSLVLFYETDMILKLNPHPVWSQVWHDMIFFGDDQGGYVYFFDPKNLLEHGHWAIYGGSMSAPNTDYAIFIASDITQFVTRILADEDVLYL